MDVHLPLSAYLQRTAPNASYGHPGYWVNVRLGPGWSAETVEALAETFLADADFQALRLGTWLGTPEGRVITATVEHGLPYPYRQYSQLFVLALTRAAQLQAAPEQDKARKRMLAVAGGAVILAAATLLGRSG
jgi:hypothetical protein